MSESKVDAEIVGKQYTNDASLIDTVEIIDVFTFDFSDTDCWLYIPPEYQTQTTVQNLHAWLRSEPDLILSGNRRSIDTRTFTRPKKRSSRINFESILENLSPTVANTWKTSCLNCFSNIEEDLSKHLDIPNAKKEETIPLMLKMTPVTNLSLLSDETMAGSGQESMEVFLNMSRSKGIDSFINLMEPGLGDPLMNVSQPSVFYSSITSLPRDDSLHNAEYVKEEETINLTHLNGHQVDRHKDTTNLNINETFSMNNDVDNNKSYCLSSVEKIFTNKSNINKQMELNETYKTVSKTLLPSSSDKIKHGTTNLSSTFVNKGDENTKLLQSENSAGKADNSLILDATYCTAETAKTDTDTSLIVKSDTCEDKNQACDLQNNAVCSVSGNLIEPSIVPVNCSFSFMNDNALDSTFKLPIALGNQSTPKNLDALNSTFKMSNKEPTRVYNTVFGSNFKAPTSLRKELLAEIHRSGDHKLDCTFNHASNEVCGEKAKQEIVHEVPDQNIRNEIPVENKYNTYKKESSVNKTNTRTEIVSDKGACIPSSQDKKYYTFTKKNNAHGGKTDMENTESSKDVDTTFVKPLPKLQKKKQHIPRMLSKLPQFLQKSNPNLVCNSLKTVNMTGCMNPSSIGYMKGSQPNIVRDVEKSLANKLYSLGKMKSGSEQRLLELNTGVGELQMMGAGGSTESIESTQSAHSAPDLDDRLSTCSDSSHNSYTVQPMNIEQLHQIVRMQEESLKQDAMPQLNNRVLENNWVDIEKDLPSPIMKNGINSCESNSSSPLSTDSNMKTSSPILSPTRSNQSINTDDHPMEHVLKEQTETGIMNKTEVFNKPTMKIENRTRLRQPTNWNTGNRTSNTMSAIPRPQSRIPGPRFVRPIVKNTQGDVKRGYM
ncbi:uncharacterized protein LOC122401430 isoform X1 [Colletes gigas]|uniref:uncharacterized protein LOC122401430 isoform X1 n=1 Tax=Colletes gigas TaxID=935657 RepID=UPI001C9B4491|nr:uncharacterized protein LOC122401430 isoform X1 [Colletes gigas]